LIRELLKGGSKSRCGEWAVPGDWTLGRRCVGPDGRLLFWPVGILPSRPDLHS